MILNAENINGLTPLITNSAPVNISNISFVIPLNVSPATFIPVNSPSLPWYIAYLPEILIGIAVIGGITFLVFKGKLKFLRKAKGSL
ncbi:hypothetical protein V6M85_12785 [Sulfolobus tengchongensis]|uniref:Uncharacterized protein n=1 Tax=Sulfolobus tengchongensis TaxID=207809 RepID=A0AAX4L001_9CREN